MANMSGGFDPRVSVVPIFGRNETHAPAEVGAFLGTGSLIGDGSILLTADHVIAGWSGKLVIAVVPNISNLHPLTVIERDTAHDLALLKVEGYRSPRPLVPRFDQSIPPNWTASTFEFGTTRSLGRAIELSPATRLGNVTRVLTVEQLGAAGVDALELSFPALRGASGSPVMFENASFGLIGVIVANVQYHLLPAQIENVLTADNTHLKETVYMLPQAVAVNVRHLKPMYERLAESAPDPPI
jgi:hypothetical protein